jgi:hypothetical protein
MRAGKRAHRLVILIHLAVRPVIRIRLSAQSLGRFQQAFPHLRTPGGKGEFRRLPRGGPKLIAGERAGHATKTPILVSGFLSKEQNRRPLCL